MDLAISPCPNDTFIFYHMKKSNSQLQLEFADVEELNRRALNEKRHMISKLSFFAILKAEGYQLLDCGGAMGQGCGPLLLFAKGYDGGIENLKRILIPGRMTTAALLLELYLNENHPNPRSVERVPVRYDQILPSLAPRDQAAPSSEAGLIIHEDRFVYPKYGLRAAVDLGAWWEQTTNLPIPLGGIVVRRDAGAEFARQIEQEIRDSLKKAWGDPESTRDFVKQYSQSLEDSVIQSHIDLYVNKYTESFGDDGRTALTVLKEKATNAGLL